jgi:two-component system, NtrC family, response regulator HydG
MKRRVMLVDDNQAFLDSTKDVLEYKGYEVVTADSGEEAIKLLKEQDFDVVIMDIKMPGINGVESFIEMKKIRPGVAVIMITAYSIDSLIQKALDEGAYSVLKKPLNMNALFTTIDNLGTGGKGGLILIADDDRDLCDNLEKILSSKGYKVISAYNGEAAVEIAQLYPVDILLIDMKLPILNGLEVFHQISKIKPKTVAIIITAYAQEMHSLIQGMLDEKARVCLTKPLDMRKLLTVLESECAITKDRKDDRQ